MTQGVYFMQRQDGAVKVGRSVDVEARRRHLERYWGPLDILAVLECPPRRQRRLERQLHAALRGTWLGRQGDAEGCMEWYGFSAALRQAMWGRPRCLSVEAAYVFPQGNTWPVPFRLVCPDGTVVLRLPQRHAECVL